MEIARTLAVPLVLHSPFVVCCPTRAQSTPPRIVASLAVPQRPLMSSNWEIFSERISGEWDGYGAEFSSSGEPRALPSSVVPEAFKEWEVQLFDWQTQCPTTAKEIMQYKLMRLLPTVGCEADAATQYSVDDRKTADSGFFAFHESGSYIIVWHGRRILRESLGASNSAKCYSWEGDKQGAFEVEHCLVHGGELKFRVRILQQIVMETTTKDDYRSVPVLKNITVQREKWESEFRNGEVLGGCSTSGSAFATTSTLQGSELSGVWQNDNFSTQLEPLCAEIQELVYIDSDTDKRELSENMLPLPKGLWSKIVELEDGDFSLAAGWLVNEDSAITSSCEIFSTGKAKRARIQFKERIG